MDDPPHLWRYKAKDLPGTDDKYNFGAAVALASGKLISTEPNDEILVMGSLGNSLDLESGSLFGPNRRMWARARARTRMRHTQASRGEGRGRAGFRCSALVMVPVVRRMTPDPRYGWTTSG